MAEDRPRPEPDPPEVESLERAAEQCLRRVDRDPGDRQSAEAAARLQKLADDVRGLQAGSLWREYMAINNWLAESDDLADFVYLAHEYRMRIGVDVWPATGEDYLRDLLALAKQTFGIP